MNRLSNDDRSRVLACLVEGNSIRATVRITGIAKKTIQRLGDHVWELSELIGLLEVEERIAA